MAQPLTRDEIQELVQKTVKRLLRSDADTEKIIMQMIKNGLIQYSKSIYTRRGFWSGDIRNSGT